MSWLELVKTTFGPLVGAAIALAAIWIKEFAERKRAIQDWYEESYIEDGVDHLISYALLMEFTLMDIQSFEKGKSFLAHDEIQMVPTKSIVKLQTVLQTEVFTILFPALFISVRTLSEEDAEPEEVKAIIGVAHELHAGLFDLRKELLKIKVKRKAEIYGISQKPEILSALARTETKVEEARMRVVEVEDKLMKSDDRPAKRHRAMRTKLRKHARTVK
ncbi:MAG TPA: hypothetical protein VGJ69_06685 [Pyrinomonadaceae bacterium]|jgi:hypothetical protein